MLTVYVAFVCSLSKFCKARPVKQGTAIFPHSMWPDLLNSRRICSPLPRRTRKEVNRSQQFARNNSHFTFYLNQLKRENRFNSATGVCEMGILPDREQWDRKVMTLPLSVSPRCDWQVAQQAISSKGSFSSPAPLCDLQQSCGSTETQHHGAAFHTVPVFTT